MTGRKKPRGTAKSRICARVHSGFGGEEAGLGVEVDEAVHAGGDEEVAVLEEADVAVAAAHAYGECAVVEASRDVEEVALPVERDDVCGVGGVAAPGFEGSRTGGGCRQS